jgi:hypothetical protein
MDSRALKLPQYEVRKGAVRRGKARASAAIQFPPPSVHAKIRAIPQRPHPDLFIYLVIMITVCNFFVIS